MAKHPLLTRRNAERAMHKAKAKNASRLKAKIMPNWFAKLSAPAQKEYLAKHPNSKYGKGIGYTKPKTR